MDGFGQVDLRLRRLRIQGFFVHILVCFGARYIGCILAYYDRSDRSPTQAIILTIFD